MPTRTPDASRDDASEAAQERPRRAKRKRSEEKFYISLCADGTKTGRREDRGSIPVDVDPGDYIEESSHCEPGLYRIEKRRAGEFGEVGWYTKEDLSETARDAGEEDAPRYEDFPAPVMQQSGNEDARIKQAVAEALADHERRQRAANPQPTALDILQEVREQTERALAQERERYEREREREDRLRQQITDAVTARQNPQTDPLTTFTTMLDSVLDVSERVLPMREAKRERRGKFGQAMDAVNEFVTSPAAPMIMGQIASFFSRGKQGAQQAAPPMAAQPYAPAPAPQPAPPVALAQPAQEEDEPFTFETVIGNIKQDLLDDETPEQSVNDIVRLVAEFPQVAPEIEQLLNMPNAEILARLSLATQTNLSILANANKFIDGLRKGVRSRLGQPQAAEVAAPLAPTVNSKNGSNAQTAEAASAK